MGIVAKYKFDGSVYADLIPEFNAEFTDYTVTDEIEGNIITRTIESDGLPTLMRFGRRWVSGESSIDNRTGSLLEVLDMDTSGLTDCHSMFRHCKNLTSITCEWDTSKVTNMQTMFDVCNKLTTLDVSNFVTNNVTNMSNMFYGCKSLTALDVSNFDTSKVTDTTGMFDNTLLLKDIGMIYCNKDTINKVASLLSTDIPRTIWVESDDILQYDQYDHITYKTQKVQDTVHLNSPLLKGDTIEVIDGKTYHVHRYEKVVLNGSENWQIQNTYQENNTVCFMLSNLPYSKKAGELNFTNDRFINYKNYPLQTEIFKEGFSINTQAEYGRFAYIRLDISRLPALTVDNFKQWLSENPTTVIYELATPYYELISEEPLELTLLDTTDNTINNNSILPSNMTIANKELSTIAIKPSTTYTLSFDKSNVDSEVTIDICGGEQITTVGNVVQLTTPSELGSGIRFISSDGCIVSNVRLLEGSLVESAMPKETFEGLQSSFEGNLVTQEMVDSGEESAENLDKYKVEYKVTGKNKFDLNKPFNVNYGLGPVVGNPIISGNGIIPNGKVGHYSSASQDYSNIIKQNTNYTISFYSENVEHNCRIYDNSTDTDIIPPISVSANTRCHASFNIENRNPADIRIIFHASVNNDIHRILDIQIEEGTVATEYEPYKEDIKTYYLSSPFLEGDTIEDINGVATHVKRYGKVVLDGSESWICDSYSPDEYGYYGVHKQLSKDAKLQGKMYSNNFRCYRENIDTQSNGEKLVSGLIDNYGVILILKANKLQSYNNEGIKQWLSQNPTTVVYELASPIYEPISTESILLDSYTNGHLDLSNENIPIEKVKFINWYDNLKYLQSNTRYTVQFESDNAGKLDTLGVGGSYLYNQNVVKGLNEFILTTNSTPTTTLSVTGIGFNISNIQVVAIDKDIEFDYFKGLQSSFEDGLVTDVNDENYGKYAVECKIVGKNKFDGEISSIYNDIYTFNNANGLLTANDKTNDSRPWGFNNAQYHIKLHKGTYTITCQTVTPSTSMHSQIRLYTTENETITYISVNDVNTIGTYSRKFTLNEDMMVGIEGKFFDGAYYIQIEEGTQATSYEPYKESIYTLYLNSPLLKGDKLVVHDGKLCHYHKMGMIVLDGNENWTKSSTPGTVTCRFYTYINNIKLLNSNWESGVIKYSDKFKADISCESSMTNNIEAVSSTKDSDICINIKSIDNIDGFKQWLSKNPTTVVYELAEPYYEPIEPQLSQYSFSTVKDGDMEIITVLPIEKINLTYRTDINGVSSIEEQIASIQEGTDISSIIDEEVDE